MTVKQLRDELAKQPNDFEVDVSVALTQVYTVPADELAVNPTTERVILRGGKL